jgi:hypothetical protein
VPFLLFLCLGACQTSHPTEVASKGPTLLQYETPTRIVRPTTTSLIPTPLFITTRNPKDATPISVSDATTRWLMGIPCEAPCWEGVTPGKTTGLDAAHIWGVNPLFSRVSIGEFGINRIFFELNTTYLVHGEVTFFYSVPQDDPNAPISQIFVPAFREVKLGDLIQAFGPPSNVIAEIDEIGFEQNWILNIIWLDKGFSIWYKDALPPPKIDENLSLINGFYFSPGLDGFNKTSMFMGPHGPYFLYPWHGYDDFEGYYVSPTETP